MNMSVNADKQLKELQLLEYRKSQGFQNHFVSDFAASK